jgi:hypothetical protein
MVERAVEGKQVLVERRKPRGENPFFDKIAECTPLLERWGCLDDRSFNKFMVAE